MLIIILLPRSYAASTFNLDFHVQLITQPCVVDGQTVIPVNLGSQIAASLADAEYVDFTIPLKDCPDTIPTISLKFTGNPAGAANEYIKNTGTAENVAIEIRDKTDNSLVSNGTTLSRNLSEINSADFDLKARMVPLGEISGGSVAGTVDFTIVYP